MKERFKVYKKIHSSQSQPAIVNYLEPLSLNKAFQESRLFSKKCFICGDVTHCPRAKNSCYSCSEEGHCAAEYKSKSKTPNSEHSTVNTMVNEGETVKSEKRGGLLLRRWTMKLRDGHNR